MIYDPLTDDLIEAYPQFPLKLALMNASTSVSDAAKFLGKTNPTNVVCLGQHRDPENLRELKSFLYW